MAKKSNAKTEAKTKKIAKKSAEKVTKKIAEEVGKNFLENFWSKIKSVDWDDLLGRALWTFGQAFFAVILLDVEGVINLLFAGDFAGAWTLSVATLVAAISAGLSAVKSFAAGLISQKNKLRKI